MNEKYIVINVKGIGDNNSKLKFFDNYEHILDNDSYIKKIMINSTVSEIKVYLHDYLKVDNRDILTYIMDYIGSIMIAILKNCYTYSSIMLSPTLTISSYYNLDGKKKSYLIKDKINVTDNLTYDISFNSHDVIDKWVLNIPIDDYRKKRNRYDILFLLLQGNNTVQKYMALYAYLMSLVKEINNKSREGQKQVIEYINKNANRVGISIELNDRYNSLKNQVSKEDKFTLLRNKIAHPDIKNDDEKVNLNMNILNELVAIVCCAIGDIEEETTY